MPPADYDIPLGPDRAVILQTMKPEADAWADRGYKVVQDMPADCTHGLVVVPRSRTLAQGLISAAASLPGTCAVDGQKTDGTDSLFKEIRQRLGTLPTLTRDHGRLFWFDTEAATFADWQLPAPAPGPDGFHTAAGAFSEGKIDPGSALLAAALPAKLPGHVIDLGAGWGYLSRAILDRSGVTRLDVVEAEARALDCARLNLPDDRATFHWADALTFRPEGKAGAVVMNPPFHQGRKGDPDLGRAFIAAAAGMLAPSGRLWCVANRHLPYEAELQKWFGQVEELPGSSAFKLTCAARPIEARVGAGATPRTATRTRRGNRLG